ncbi:MAG: hypothetical protein ACKVHQ_09540, partial [Gammaproteobacteria bacterium]
RSMFCIFFILNILSHTATYSEESPIIYNGSINNLSVDKSIILTQNTEKVEESTPQSGTLLLPESLIPDNKEEKKCMTVCAQWGEDCTFINRGAGGMTRNCRRTCQQFSEECF